MKPTRAACLWKLEAACQAYPHLTIMQTLAKVTGGNPKISDVDLYDALSHYSLSEGVYKRERKKKAAVA